ncbi:MAG: hypothetical protein OEL89_01855 [Candidatus Peregrinibacteria bacterium]|nr:hypothetical protein [Candidatus Peregrinibacteria bacterium]
MAVKKAPSKMVSKKREYKIDVPKDVVDFHRDRAQAILEEGGPYKEALNSLSVASETAIKYGLSNREDVGREYKLLQSRQNPFDDEATTRRAAYSFVSVATLASGFVFFSGNITGNVIGFNETSSNILGAVLIVVGVIAASLYFKKRV